MVTVLTQCLPTCQSLTSSFDATSQQLYQSFLWLGYQWMVLPPPGEWARLRTPQQFGQLRHWGGPLGPAEDPNISRGSVVTVTFSDLAAWRTTSHSIFEELTLPTIGTAYITVVWLGEAIHRWPNESPVQVDYDCNMVFLSSV